MQSMALHFRLTMRYLPILAMLIIGMVTYTEAVPVLKQAKERKQRKKEESLADDLLPEVSYRQYLAEVINILESDKAFSNRMRHLNTTEDMASQLEFASHSVRSRLDEIKRQEVERLNGLEKMLEAKLAAKGDPAKAARVPVRPEVLSLDEGTILRAHVDDTNPHSFEAADLQKLIRQVTDDLMQVEAARDAEFKRYEMNKELMRQQMLHRIKSHRAREEVDRQFQAEKAKHRMHQKLHQPGSREQLKETWEQEDHMDKDSFDPKTFFMLHDINGDGHLDMGEIEALFQKELDKAYDSKNDTRVDMVERQHEMERMRRSMMERMDTNRDMMLSWQEFDHWTRSQDYQKDEGWATTEDEKAPPFSEEEYKAYEEEYNKEHPDNEQHSMEPQHELPGAPMGDPPSRGH